MRATSLSVSCARHAKAVVAAWLAALGLSVAVIAACGASAFTTQVERFDGSESVRAEALLRARFAGVGARLPNETLILRADTLTVDDPAYRRQVQAVVSRLRALGGDVVAWTTSYPETGAASLVSTDRHMTLVPMLLRDPRAGVARVLDALGDDVIGEGFHLYTVGRGSIGRDYLLLAREDLATEVRFGLPVALAVLLAVFSSAVAALVPVLMALFSIALALAVATLAGQAVPVYFLVTNMIVMMGLALGIDYSLFVLSRYREERRRGHAPLESIGVAGATAGRSVLYSSATVACALAGLALVPTNVFRSLGLGAILAAVTSVLAALTLLPALIALLGERLETLRVPLPRLRAGAGRGGKDGLWSRAAAGAARRPLASLVAAGALLAAAAAPTLQMNAGFAGIETLPERMPSRQAYRLLQEQFDYGAISKALIVLDGDLAAPRTQQGLERLRASLQTDRAFLLRDATFDLGADGRTAALAVPMLGEAEDPRIQDAVRRLRRDYIPAAFREAPARALVAGTAAGYVDFFGLTTRYAPAVLAFVLAVTFVLLAAVFRSLVVPLKAVLLNLLSVGAAFGLTVLVFQHGIGASLLGFRPVDFVEAWIPLFLFCVLFGLSMDYHVFLLSRIQERYARTGRNDEAVAFGLRATAGIITGAALIMAAIFAGFASGELVMFQQAGFGLGVAVLLDATVVRVVMVPAAMRLLGERNWHLPRWLDWLPRL